MPRKQGGTTVKVENLREVAAQIRATGDQGLKKGLREANRSVSEIVVRAALPYVPVGTNSKNPGALKRSVKAMATQKAAYAKAGTPARVPYAAAIHWGEGAGNVGGGASRRNRNIRGRPFLWDAADRTINRAVKEYEDQIQDLLDKVR